MVDGGIKTDIQRIKESLARLEGNMEKGFKKKADRRVQSAMMAFIGLICLTVIGAVIANVVKAFNY